MRSIFLDPRRCEKRKYFVELPREIVRFYSQRRRTEPKARSVGRTAKRTRRLTSSRVLCLAIRNGPDVQPMQGKYIQPGL